MTLDELKRDAAALDAELRLAGAVIDGDRAHAHCGFHEDQTGSLALFTGDDGGAAWCCHAGCGGGSVVDARIKRLSVTPAAAIKSLLAERAGPASIPTAPKAKQTFPSLTALVQAIRSGTAAQGRTLAGTWTYRDSDGLAVFATMRIDSPEGKKFLQAHAEPDGTWVFGALPGPLPVYCPRELTTAGPVLVVEGEKCADAVDELGILSVTSAGGAGAAARTNWTPLAGRNVTIWPDNDGPGLRYAAAVTRLLHALEPPARVRLINVSGLGLPPGGDCVDFTSALITEGKDRPAIRASVQMLLERAEPAPQPEPAPDALRSEPSEARVMSVAELLEPQDDDTGTLLGRRWLCRGGGALLVGQTGIGKSSLAMQAAVSWAAGKDLFGLTPARPLKSLVIQAENDRGDLSEQLRGVLAGLEVDPAAVEERLFFILQDSLTGPVFTTWLRAIVAVHRPDLLWIDPLLSYLGGDVSDQRTVSAFLRNGLNPVLHESGCAAIIVHHTPKPPRDADARARSRVQDLSYLGMGSADLPGWARAVLVLREQDGGSFELRAAKRGGRAGFLDSQGSPANPVYLHHSPTRICWERAAEPEAVEEQAERDAAEAVVARMEPSRTYTKSEVGELVCEVMHRKKSSLYSSGSPINRTWYAAMKQTRVAGMPQFFRRPGEAVPGPETGPENGPGTGPENGLENGGAIPARNSSLSSPFQSTPETPVSEGEFQPFQSSPIPVAPPFPVFQHTLKGAGKPGKGPGNPAQAGGEP